MKEINYPDGRKMELPKKKDSLDHRKKENRSEADRARDKYVKANMGMNFESDVSKSCEAYSDQGREDEQDASRDDRGSLFHGKVHDRLCRNLQGKVYRLRMQGDHP